MKRLSDYNLPDAIGRLSREETGELCRAIRTELVETVSKTGGHLASNLGVVELTVALFRVFDFPRDRLIWDVGHQSYVYKLLSGRADRFSTLRTFGGLSGFPKRAESPYDAYDSGHSSTSISAAMGMAAARDLAGTDERIVCVIGDGALTGGVAFEGLNNVGSSKTSMTVILNDNNMSISPARGGLSKHLGRLRTNKDYLVFKANLKRTLSKSSAGRSVYNSLERQRDRIRTMLLPRAIFDEFGLKYIGPIDGHDLDELTDTLSRVREMEGPVLVHVITKKGKGYEPAEHNPSLFHGIGPFDPLTGKPVPSGGGESFSSVFGRTLTGLAEKDPTICAVTAAMTEGTGLKPFAQRFPNRFFDAEIAEQHAVSFAAGLALRGFRPCVAVYSTFLQRAYDEILTEVCLQNLPVVFAIDRAGIVGRDGETHHGIFDLSYLLPMPNLTVLAPRDGEELERMLSFAFTQNGPVAIRYPRGSADAVPFDGPRSAAHPLPEPSRNPSRPVPSVQGSGRDAVLFACGAMVRPALEAQRILRARGTDVTVCDPGCLKPLDEAFLRSVTEGAGRIFTLEDNVTSGGFGDAVQTVLVREGKTVRKLGWPDAFIPHGSQTELFSRYGLDGASIAETVLK